MNIRNETTHKQTQKRLNRIEARLILDESLRTSHERPAANQERNPSIGTKLLADQPAGKFSRKKAQEKDLEYLRVSRPLRQGAGEAETNCLAVVEIISVHP